MKQPQFNIDWFELVIKLCSQGSSEKPRGLATNELLGVQTVVDMKQPLLTLSSRNLSYKFALAEAYWIISGDNSVAGINPFNKNIHKFSDNGVSFFGAYGPKIVEQISYACDALIKDKHSRQSVINIWRENPSYSKDVPCTLSVQFIIRNDQLYCIDTMRSSDVWLGLPYDVFNFSMLSAYIVLKLRHKYSNLQLGNLILNAGSQHIYDTNIDAANKLTREVAFKYESLNLDQFDSANRFLSYLGVLRTLDNPSYIKNSTWLIELIDWRYSKSVEK